MKALAGAAALLLTAAGLAQPYDLLLQGGHLIDPKNGIDGPRDIAVAGGRIAAVAAVIPPAQARRVVNLAGLHVAPGFIDIHAHVFVGGRANAVWADGYTFRSGVTTAVEAGGVGWRDFAAFKKDIIDRAQTRILVFLNIAGRVVDNPSAPVLADMIPAVTADFIKRHREYIVGIKTAHWRLPTWESVDAALEAGRLADVPIMVDFGTFFPQRPFEELVGKRLRPGDIYTHLYLMNVPMLNDQGRLRPYLLEAQRRGVIFDAGHGQGSFAYQQAVPATRDGFWPNTISTDLHKGSMNRGMKDMANVMSKFLNLGLPLPEVIARSTWSPAQVIRRPELGHLSVGSGADIAVFKVEKGEFGFYDIRGGRQAGDQRILSELTLRDGVVVWDLNARSMPPWNELPPDARNR